MKNTYLEITQNGKTFIVEAFFDIQNDLASNEPYTINPIEMTDEEFDSLPEFQGY